MNKLEVCECDEPLNNFYRSLRRTKSVIDNAQFHFIKKLAKKGSRLYRTATDMEKLWTSLRTALFDTPLKTFCYLNLGLFIGVRHSISLI